MRWLLVLVLVVAGCNPPKDGPGIQIVDAGADDNAAPDAATDARPIDGSAIDVIPISGSCTASTTYTGAITQDAGTEVDSVYWLGRMDPTSMPDFLQLTLYSGYGAFANGITEGTVQLTGEELGYATCGACIFLFTDLHAVGQSLEVTDYYMPTGGTIELTSVTGTFQGTITNLTLQHMIISGQDLVPANDGCTVSMPTVTMNAVIP